MQGCACSPGFDRHASFLFHGDCLEVLRDLPDESVDCIITDPPYGIKYQSLSKSLPKTTVANDGPEAYSLLDTALAIAVRKLKFNSHVYIFTNWQAYPAMRAVAERYFTLKNLLVWDKGVGTRGDLRGNYSFQSENIMFFHHGRRLLNNRRDGNILHFAKVPSNHMQHPTQKPIALLKYLIEKSTNVGETVLDMFMGSGSTCVAAKSLQRNCVGIDIDEGCYEVAKGRLAVAV